MEQAHVYTRAHQAHAWKYEQTTSYEAAELAREANKGFTVETLLVPAICPALRFLDSYQSQIDFRAFPLLNGQAEDEEPERRSR